MERRKVLMGNWKMYKTVGEARTFAEQLGTQADKLSKVLDYAVFPPLTAVHVLRVTLPTQVKLGAQNVYFEEQGAFTGEVSTGMLTDVGVSYVLVGHSERRSLFGESDPVVQKKVRAVVTAGLTPVLCVGEDLAERESDQTLNVVTRQVKAGLADLTAEEVAASIVAYEPVWAIGTGKTASAEDAEAVISSIREVIRSEKGDVAADAVRILYGGSVKPENAASFVAQPNIDGGLVGGASLQAESFVKMAVAMAGGDLA